MWLGAGLAAGIVLSGSLEGAPSVKAAGAASGVGSQVPAPLRAVFEKHCLDCHDAGERKGGLDLDALAFDLGDRQTMAAWERVYDRMSLGEMPPKKKAPIAAGAKSAAVGVLGTALLEEDRRRKGTVLRRLNRVEYENTLHDLLGGHAELKEMLPEDGSVFGFDNVGEALDLSAVHLQRYMEAAGVALREAVQKGPAPESRKVAAAFDSGRNAEHIGKHWHRLEDGSVVFFARGAFPSIESGDVRIGQDGVYRIQITGRAYQSAAAVVFDVLATQPRLGAATHPVGTFEFSERKGSITVEVFLRKDEKIRFIPHLSPDQKALQTGGPAAYKGAGLALEPVQMEGPLVGEWPSAGHRLLFGDLAATARPAWKGAKTMVYEMESTDVGKDAARLLAGFATRAFRRPVGEQKVTPYVRMVEEEVKGGSNFEAAMLNAYTAVLCAPDFLYLKESAGRLDDLALASRLSYMLWGSLPDAELLAAAAKGQLVKSEVLRAQTERMLKDARVARFTENFTGQWLGLRDIEFTVPDAKLYPEFDGALKEAMVRETRLFFEEMLGKNLHVLQFIDSDWTMLNERLARHYGVEGVKGVGFRRVPLKAEHHRGGVLTHASVLKVSANGTNTSPVVRGAWVLDRILGTPPAPPPPGIPGVEPDIRGATTLRQLLEKHRNLESCNGCHSKIDPPGFALESYDPTGGWREFYRSLGDKFPKPTNLPAEVRNVAWRVGPPVDASGVTAGGAAFKDLAEFKRLITASPERFPRALALKLATYGSGRGMGISDRPELARITAAVAKKGNGFRDMVHEVIQSDIFRSK